MLTKYYDKSCTFILNNKIDSVPWISRLRLLKSFDAWYVSFCSPQRVYCLEENKPPEITVEKNSVRGTEQPKLHCTSTYIAVWLNSWSDHVTNGKETFEIQF